MPASQSVTEIIILSLKQGVNLHDVADGTADMTRPAVQAFVRLVNTVRDQQGFRRQLWGHQVENPRIFVWSIDWQSFQHYAAFAKSKENTSFIADTEQVFDVEKIPPITSIDAIESSDIHLTYRADLYIAVTSFTSDAYAALAAPVTEVAFFTLPNGYTEQDKTTIENALDSTSDVVETVGKATGGAIGWVIDSKNAANTAAAGDSIALLGVFGYQCVDDHVKWRQTPEHAQVIKDIRESPIESMGLKDAILPGGHIFDPDSSMFHVKFREG